MKFFLKNCNKKVLVFALVTFFALSQNFAFSGRQTCSAMDGDKIFLKAAIGLGLPTLSKWGAHATLVGFAVPIEFQYIFQKIPIAVGARFVPNWGKYSGWWSGSNYAITAGVSYHFDPGPDNLDLYAGLGLGVKIATMKYYGAYAGFAFDIHAGINYWFTDVIGVNAEVGWPSVINAGIALKF